MKKLKFLLLTSLLLLTSCSKHKEQGYVMKKNHNEPWVQTIIINRYNGKTLMPIPYFVYHLESWSLDLRDEDRGKYKEYTVYLKDEKVWEEIKVGDYFVWNEDVCFDCEPTTKERQ